MEFLRKWFPHIRQRQCGQCLEWKPKISFNNGFFGSYVNCYTCRNTEYCPACRQTLPEVHFRIDANHTSYETRVFVYCDRCRALIKHAKAEQAKQENK